MLEEVASEIGGKPESGQWVYQNLRRKKLLQEARSGQAQQTLLKY